MPTKKQTVNQGGPVGFSAGQILALGPAAWFRKGIGITVATGVSQWNDVSGNARHLKQATGASQPALQADNTILFNGSSHFLKCDAFTLNQPETVYIKFRQVTWTSGRFIFDGNTVVSGGLSQTSSTPNLSLNAGSGAANNTGLAVGTYGVAVVVFNGAGSSLQIGSGAPATGNPGAGNMGGFTLGAAGSNNVFSNIQVVEIIVFASAHNATQKANVLSYLATV